MKKVIKVILFIVIFLILWQNIFSIIWLNPTSLREFYREPKNSLDVMYVGSSNAYAHFNTVYAYHKYGFTTGMLSTSSQPAEALKYVIEEGRKRQNPQVYVIDISSIITTELAEFHIRNVVDSMPFSINKLKATYNMLKHSELEKSDYINYYLSYLKYHSSWKEISKYKFKNTDLYKGHLLAKKTTKTIFVNDEEWVDGQEDLTPYLDEILNDLISYLKEKDINAIFIISKRNYFAESTIRQLNTIEEKLTKENYKVINFNKIDVLTTSRETDYYNEAHFNCFGATKYTAYFAKYLKENYNLPDHRNDQKFASWDEEYERYKESFKLLTKKDFEEYSSSVEKELDNKKEQ